MEPSREAITQMLYGCLDQLNEQRSQGEPLQKSPDTRLAGEAGSLDSLGFVNLVAAVEEACEERFGRAVMLTESRWPADVRDPFQTVRSLAEYVELALCGRLLEWR